MNILAIDASTKASGYAIFNIENKQLLHYELTKSSSSDTLKRIDLMLETVERLIEEFNISKIVVEDVKPDYNMRTMRPLMYLQARIAFLAYNKDIELELLTPSSWRSKCGIKTGRGIKRAELKQADIEFANNTYNLSLDSDDIADAIGIGHAIVFGKQDHQWK